MSRTGENIYKRKDGRWEARYIDSYDGNGKAKYKYLYAPTYTEVKAKLLKAQNYADLSSDLEKTKDKEKYEYWLDAWLHAKRLGVKESTYIRYRNTIENHIKPDLGKYPINKISTSLMEQFVSRKLQNGRIDGNGGLSPKSMSDIFPRTPSRTGSIFQKNRVHTCTCTQVLSLKALGRIYNPVW